MNLKREDFFGKDFENRDKHFDTTITKNTTRSDDNISDVSSQIEESEIDEDSVSISGFEGVSEYEPIGKTQIEFNGKLKVIKRVDGVEKIDLAQILEDSSKKVRIEETEYISLDKDSSRRSSENFQLAKVPNEDHSSQDHELEGSEIESSGVEFTNQKSIVIKSQKQSLQKINTQARRRSFISQTENKKNNLNSNNQNLESFKFTPPKLVLNQNRKSAQK